MVDGLGRVVIPIKLRKKLNIKAYDQLEFTQKDNTIIVKKANNTFDFEDFLKRFIVYKYGSYYQDIMIDSSTIKEIENILCDYFEDRYN